MEEDDEEKQKFDHMFRILLIGDTAVGKSALLLRFTDGFFEDTFIATIGIDFKTKILNIDGKLVKIQIWDTAGQERFRTITTAYYRTAQGVLMTYDVTSPSSFQSLGHWAEQISMHASENVVRFLVGNKCDLENKVGPKQTKELSDKLGIPIFETSAKSGKGVNELFEALARKLLQNVAPSDEGNEKKGVNLNPTNTGKDAPTSSGCC